MEPKEKLSKRTDTSLPDVTPHSLETPEPAALREERGTSAAYSRCHISSLSQAVPECSQAALRAATSGGGRSGPGAPADPPPKRAWWASTLRLRRTGAARSEAVNQPRREPGQAA